LHHSDIQIAHSFDFYTNLSLVPAARLARVPVVIGSQRQLGDLLTPAQSKAQLAMFRWCDAVVCNSEAAADRLKAEGLPAEKVVVIGNGVPDSLFTKAEPALPRMPGRKRVGMIARMNSRAKNHEVFLRCAEILHTKLAKVDFVLVGDGPLRAELEASAERLGLGSRVYFLGDRRDIPEILASFDVSVLPSASESLSNVVIESMAAGVPVVASRVGGNVELLNDGRGILVESSEHLEFAAAVERLVKDESLGRLLACRARKFANENFGMEKMGRHYRELYEELLKRKKWRPRNESTAAIVG
jgi:glycosyltransferase involved in cell wall biosynthesis